MATDKNLGPAIIDTKTYIDQALRDHLLNETNYQKLSQAQVGENLVQVYHQIMNLTLHDTVTFEPGSAEHVYFQRALSKFDCLDTSAVNEKE